MLYTNGLLCISRLGELLEYLPVTRKYYDLTVEEKIPVAFVLYARYREASLSFDAEGDIAGYSEPAGEKDVRLKELFIMVKDCLGKEGLREDLAELWKEALKCYYDDENAEFPALLACYMCTGSAVDSYSQADDDLTREVAGLLSAKGSKNILELTGHIGLLGDEYTGWDSYSAYIENWKESFMDELLKEMNENRAEEYLNENIFVGRDVRLKGYDTIIVNLTDRGGISSDHERNERIEGLVGRALEYRSTYTEWKCRWMYLVTDAEFCNSERLREARGNLNFYGCVSDVSIVYTDGGGVSVVVLDFSKFNKAVSYRTYSEEGKRNDSGSRIKTFDMPLSVIRAKDDCLDPEQYEAKPNETGERMKFMVAVVGSPLTDAERKYLEGNGIIISYEVKSSEELSRLLRDDASRPLRTVNAVIFDAMTEYDEGTMFKYEGLVRANKLASETVPIYVYSNVLKEDIGPYADYVLESLFRFGRYYGRKDRKNLEDLTMSLRLQLENSTIPDASIRNKYKEEILAADWLDKTGEVSRTIIRSMRDDFEEDKKIDGPQDLLNGLRKCAETVFNTAKGMGILPPLERLGQMQQLLRDGYYYDNELRKFFVLKDKGLMPDALAFSFGYLIDMTNGASHADNGKNMDVAGYIAKTRRAGIYKACVFILMDIICWYRTMCQINTFRRYEEQNLFEPYDCVKGIILPDSGREFLWIGKVHLIPRPGKSIVGVKASSINIHNVRMEKNEYGLKELKDVLFFARPDDYDIR